MNATITLSSEDVEQIVKEFVKKQIGDVKITRVKFNCSADYLFEECEIVFDLPAKP